MRKLITERSLGKDVLFERTSGKLVINIDNDILIRNSDGNITVDVNKLGIDDSPSVSVVGKPVVTGSNEVNVGGTSKFEITATSGLVGMYIDKFEVRYSNLGSTDTTVLDATNSKATVSKLITGIDVGEVASMFVIAVDNLGNKSDEIEFKLTVTAPTGSTGDLTETTTVTVPNASTQLTVTGHGTAGVAEDLIYDYYYTDGRTTYSTRTYKGESYDTYISGSIKTLYYVEKKVDTSVSTIASAGNDATITGSINYTFSGADVGDTTVPETTTEVLQLPESTEDYVLTVTPNGGVISLEWK